MASGTGMVCSPAAVLQFLYLWPELGSGGKPKCMAPATPVGNPDKPGPPSGPVLAVGA